MKRHVLKEKFSDFLVYDLRFKLNCQLSSRIDRQLASPSRIIDQLDAVLWGNLSNRLFEQLYDKTK